MARSMKSAPQFPTIFTTEMIAQILGIEPWRVIKFAQSKEYGITPTMTPSGSGSRRLYDLDNLCELALALRLLETGLRSKVIGKVIRQLREKGELSTNLRLDQKQLGNLYLIISRKPELGAPLDGKREQRIGFSSKAELRTIAKEIVAEDVIVVPIGTLFGDLKRKLQKV